MKLNIWEHDTVGVAHIVGCFKPSFTAAEDLSTSFTRPCASKSLSSVNQTGSTLINSSLVHAFTLHADSHNSVALGHQHS